MPARILAPVRTHAELQSALAALCGLDVRYLLRTPQTPALYESGVVYRREAMVGGRRLEDWYTIPQVILRRSGDCEDLACWRAAELRVHGIPATPWAYRTRAGWHIIVKLPDGYEDPSARLGMRTA